MYAPHEPPKYTVITKNLLLSLANEQQPASHRRKKIKHLNKIEDIRLAFLNILKIDGLWPLTNLVKLKLNNNAIEKIENLESLMNLRELDLSFNNIKKIENLSELKHLEVLSLYHNKIGAVNGIEKLQKLAILSLGKNKIRGSDHIMVLRKLKSLQSLQINENPCSEQPGYKLELFAYVPQLIYYSYRVIQEEEKEQANAEHGRNVAALIKREAKEERELTETKLAEANNERLNNCFVEYLNEDALFQLMFSKDEDGKEFARFNEDTQAIYSNYKEKFIEVLGQLYEYGLKEHEKREDEISALESSIFKEIDIATKRARHIMENVKGKQDEIKIRITQLLKESAMVVEVDVDDDLVDHIDRTAKSLSDEYKEFISQSWANLMHDETVMHDQIEVMNSMFEQNISDLVNSFLEGSVEYFTQLRTLESKYYDNLAPHVITHVNSLEEHEKSPFLLQFFEDKDGLINCLANSHFSHLQTIDDRQDRLNNRLKDWLSHLILKIKSEEIKRNRAKVLEIKHFLQHQRDSMSISKLFGLDETEGSEDSEIDEDEDLNLNDENVSTSISILS